MNKNYHTENKTFMIYKEWEEYLPMLSDEETGRLFRALFAYAKRGEETDFGGCMKMLFCMMRNTIERDGKKWEKTCEARSHTKDAKACGKPTDKDKEKDTVKDKDKDKDKEPCEDGQKCLAASKRLEPSKQNSRKSSEHSYDLDKLVEYAWNHTPKIQK